MKKIITFFLLVTIAVTAHAQNAIEVTSQNPVETYQKLLTKIPLEILKQMEDWAASPPPVPKLENRTAPALIKAQKKLLPINQDRPYFDWVFFPDGKDYWARVLEGDEETSTSTFLHSGSTYTFKLGTSYSEVMRSTGAYPVGTKVYEMWAGYKSMVDGSNYTDVSKSFIVVQFADGKFYIGVGDPYTSIKSIAITFLHSKSKYLIDIDSKMILTSTGAYKPGEIVQKIMFYNFL